MVGLLSQRTVQEDSGSEIRVANRIQLLTVTITAYPGTIVYRIS